MLGAKFSRTMVTKTNIDQAIAKKDFRFFLKYVYILGVAGEGEGGPIPFIIWPHIEEVIKLLLSGQRRLAWLKARQIGCTWLIAAWTLWSCMYQQGFFVVEFAEKEDKAKEIIKKQKFIYTHLPTGLQVLPKSLDNLLALEFPTMNSGISAYPSTADAAIGLTTSVVWFDEFDFHEYGSEALEATTPLVNDTGGKIFLTSTSNPDSAVEGSTFKHLFANAEAMNYIPIFYGWDCRPDRDQNWYDEAFAAATDKFTFIKHYPRTIQEALSAPAHLVAFDQEVLTSMKQDVKNPVERLGLCSIYQKYVRSKKYAAATDTSHGVGADDAATGIIDVATGYIVADLLYGILSPEDLADESIKMLEAYGSPLWAIEDNDWGRSTIARALDIGYTNLYYQAEDKPGWHTNNGNRFPIWSELIEAIKQRLITIPNEQGLNQFFTVVRNPKKNGRIEAQRGGKDDYPMMCAILWQMRKEQAVYAGATSQAPIQIVRWR